MRVRIRGFRLAVLSITAGILVSVSGCTSASSPVEPEMESSRSLYGNVAG